MARMTFPEQAEYFRNRIKGKVLVRKDGSRYYRIGVVTEDDYMYIDYGNKDWDPEDQSSNSAWWGVQEIKNELSYGSLTLEDPTKEDQKIIEEKGFRL